ncbi:hypothetical protein ACI3L1_15560 [Deinococcus sp. SM5_A1]|uniref:hypothetical protein n=1 Tax=Deinococcus sp. SM5_A1 TaxID=3379094 RepID=UPI00385D8969
MMLLPDGLPWILGTVMILLALLRERRAAQAKPSPQRCSTPTGHSARKDQS